MSNSIHVIKPYRYEGMWVFDDPAVGLVREPFVAGADSILDEVTAAIPNAENGFLAVFSDNAFPDENLQFDWIRKEGSGDVYRWRGTPMYGWLCPALLKYFKTPPQTLHVQIKPCQN